MIVNKYTWWRRGIFTLQRIFPPARRIKNISPRFKYQKYARELADARNNVAQTIEATGRAPLFSHVEMETFNRCNGNCAFCPVNRRADPRQPRKMEESLFREIIRQLAALGFSGKVHLYSNNEPLLDDRIFDFARLAHEKLADARIVLSTNGTLLTREKFLRLIDSVDELVVDNYCDNFTFRPNIREIIELSGKNPVWNSKTRVTMRYENEIMTSRGGASPNKMDLAGKTLPFGCLAPFKQLIIRPDGKLGLCCNDALGKTTLGDAAAQPLVEAWNGEPYAEIRKAVMNTREAVDICRRCDTLIK